MRNKIMLYWTWLQALLDIRGDNILLLMSLVFIGRVALAAFGYPGLNTSEAALYSAAIAAFAYSNVNKQ